MCGCYVRSVLLKPLRGHPVDDGVSARVHEPGAHGDCEDADDENDHGPQDDVEDGWVVLIVVLCNVDALLQRLIMKKKRENKKLIEF